MEHPPLIKDDHILTPEQEETTHALNYSGCLCLMVIATWLLVLILRLTENITWKWAAIIYNCTAVFMFTIYIGLVRSFVEFVNLTIKIKKDEYRTPQNAGSSSDA